MHLLSQRICDERKTGKKSHDSHGKFLSMSFFFCIAWFRYFSLKIGTTESNNATSQKSRVAIFDRIAMGRQVDIIAPRVLNFEMLRYYYVQIILIVSHSASDEPCRFRCLYLLGHPFIGNSSLRCACGADVCVVQSPSHISQNVCKYSWPHVTSYDLIDSSSIYGPQMNDKNEFSK